MLQQILFVHLRGFSFGGAPTSVLTFGPVVVGWLLLNRCGVFASGLIDTFFFQGCGDDVSYWRSSLDRVVGGITVALFFLSCCVGILLGLVCSTVDGKVVS